MTSTLDRIEYENYAAVAEAKQQYHNAIMGGTVESTPAETIGRWMELLKLTTADIRSDQAAARQLALLESELPTKESMAEASKAEQAAVDRVDALALRHLTEKTAADNELNKASNRRNQFDRNLRTVTQQIADLKRKNPRID